MKYKGLVTFQAITNWEYEVEANNATQAREKIWELADAESPSTYSQYFSFSHLVDLTNIKKIG